LQIVLNLVLYYILGRDEITKLRKASLPEWPCALTGLRAACSGCEERAGYAPSVQVRRVFIINIAPFIGWKCLRYCLYVHKTLELGATL
jgi:hypothetical protein